MSLTEKPAETPERQAYYAKISEKSLKPLWAVLSNIITPEPRSEVQPHLWRFEDVKEHLMEAGGLISAKEAERRVLILENPGMPGKSQITTSLYAGMQLVMPGEVAPAHRHSQSALRLVLDGAGAHTAVNGERTVMNFGDFVITPSMGWHDHGNETEEPMIWLDGLDVPVLSFFDASFAEGHGEDQQPISRGTGDSLARFGANMLPIDHVATAKTSPIFNYPYERSREALEVMKKQDEWDPYHGLKMRYVNPINGDWAMPTIAPCLQLLPTGFGTAPYRSTDATVFVVTEGTGRSTIDGKTFDWGPKDVFVVPSWKWVSHEANDEAVLFSYSDRVAQEKLGIWRQDRGNLGQAGG